VERAALLRERDAQYDHQLAHTLKDICLATFAGDPSQTPGVAGALADLAAAQPDPEIEALAAWAAGVAAITEGAMEEAIGWLERAAARFAQIDMPQIAAATQVSKLIALGILGRYDEAVACGMQARDALLAAGDELAAGKIEQNLGSMAWRRDRYAEAEQFHRAARARFAAAGSTELLVAAENALAADLTSQFRLREAAERYAYALGLAQGSGLELRQAEIESNLGNLALAQGRYDQALEHLEHARRRYAALDMPHESAYAEQELAEAYLDLNMATEAAAIYARITPTFAELGMRAEQAWAMAHHGQAAASLGRLDIADGLFATARQLFAEEGNAVSVALVTLFEAQLAYQRGSYAETISTTKVIEEVFSQAGSHGRALLSRWLRAEALRALGQLEQARVELVGTLHAAEQRNLPQISQRCHTALGLLALDSGDALQAEASLMQAVAMIEELRAPLPSEELRAAFVADKLGPYAALIRLCLESDPPRAADALQYAERARARALAEMLGRSVQTLAQPRDPDEAQLMGQLSELREQLNWLYSQHTHTLTSDEPNHPLANNLLIAAQQREEEILELSRQLQFRGGVIPGVSEPLNLADLQADLGQDTIMVAYYRLEGSFLAFVVSGTAVEVVRGLAEESQVDELVGQLRFQIDALRRGARVSSAHRDQLLRRARHYLGRLHALLLAPLEQRLGERRLVVVPHRSLHYVPFHALYDGAQYVIERREVCVVPSASVLHHCLQQPYGARQRAVLLGVPDSRAPRVHDEVEALARLFPEHVVLLGDAARAQALRDHAPYADVLHLACHGTFRPDNPLFSALHLADGRFTTRDAYSLDLHCELVVLSACETGVNTVAPGDELIGLARGFFAAGAPALLVSLWMVDDASTATLMTHFYTHLRAGANPAQALRAAQCALIQSSPHPFFWAPFVLMGRW
jgi:CHAT domain-containing protein